jgi:hypothetical protein
LNYKASALISSDQDIEASYPVADAFFNALRVKNRGKKGLQHTFHPMEIVSFHILPSALST